MRTHEDDFLSAGTFQDLYDVVARRAVDLKKSDHAPLDEKEIWWALEATLRILNEANNKTVMI